DQADVRLPFLLGKRWDQHGFEGSRHGSPSSTQSPDPPQFSHAVLPEALRYAEGVVAPASSSLFPPSPKRILFLLGGVTTIALTYLLRGVLVPLFFAFLLAYALDPIVDRLELLRVPRTVG